MALASGCSDFISAAQIMFRYSGRSGPAAIQSTTEGRPSVSVPVLSMTTVSIRHSCSRAVASLIRIWFSAPLPMPTISAVGVASPSAQGQAMTSTETADSRAYEK